MNYYALFTLLMVFAMIYFKLDIGLMKEHEISTEKNGAIKGHDNNAVNLHDEYGIQESENGKTLR